ncbi:hypothetical protein PHMEG_0008000 [Phytophthora megakarya]|uniref:Uncharacterized protein n=1 Tax=Phytophthora megakarya TaxID=4795 RepID=A0A225WLU6_9STRA|nr:hypothetical protein PHMEG_0008000 [Phytophthora megakarya]
MGYGRTVMEELLNQAGHLNNDHFSNRSIRQENRSGVSFKRNCANSTNGRKNSIILFNSDWITLSTCTVTASSNRVELLRQASLIVWDEAHVAMRIAF